MFANTTRYFSIDAYLRDETIPIYKNEAQREFFNIIQNFVILFCIAQICIIYLVSGFYQVMGDSWNNGTAIYYISQIKSLSMPFFEEMSNKYIYISNNELCKYSSKVSISTINFKSKNEIIRRNLCLCISYRHCCWNGVIFIFNCYDCNGIINIHRSRL